MPATAPDSTPPEARPLAVSPSGPPPLGLYVHIPWCLRKCPYCDFNSHPLSGELPEQAYVGALLEDLEQDAAAVGGRTLESIFIGGGTPSLLTPGAVARLLGGIRERLICASDMEISLEANPGTVEQGRFEGYLGAGVNRLSLGIQSFDAQSLQRLGRIHDPAQARAAVAAARRAGFREINLDLMYGLPGQTPEGAMADLEEALGLQTPHLSYYQFTLEPHTAFGRSPPILPEEPLLDEIEHRASAAFAAAGYHHYEVSAYCRPGHPCRHNLNYWRFGDYLGIGAGAHAKLTDAPSGQVIRLWKRSHPGGYLAAAKRGPFVAGRRPLGPADLIAEFAMNSLRLREGFTSDLFEARTGLPFARLEPRLSAAVGRGLLETDGPWMRATALGRRFLNDLLALFLDDLQSRSGTRSTPDP